jgi:hypothetical protein
MGTRIDTVFEARARLQGCNAAFAVGREQWRADMATEDDSEGDVYQPLHSASVLFNQQIAAHLAVQAVLHHGMSFRYTRPCFFIGKLD